MAMAAASLPRPLPPGYMILDGAVELHDMDEADGRYGLYGPHEGEADHPLGNLHDLDEVIAMAWNHYTSGGF